MIVSQLLKLQINYVRLHNTIDLQNRFEAVGDWRVLVKLDMAAPRNIFDFVLFVSVAILAHHAGHA